MTDFTFRNDGLFVTILPENETAVKVWNETIAPETEGTGKVLVNHWPQVEKQLTDAGYSVSEATTKEISDEELADLLK